MSLLFTPIKIGPMEVPNRFVRSATFEAMATDDGRATEELARVYGRLARGEVGLIVVSLAAVQAGGRSYPRQLALGTDEAIEDVRRIVQAVRESGESRVVVQLTHGGRQGDPRIMGRRPKGPSAAVRDPIYLYRPRQMDQGDIEAVMEQFVSAAVRCREAGADGVQIHAAHTYLLSQFLSPYLNRRTDAWGGSDEGRYRLLGEVVRRVRQATGPDFSVTVKLNGRDHTPRPGVEPALAARYAGWLARDGIDAVEVSQGSVHFAPMQMSRGTVPTMAFVRGQPLWKRPAAWLMFRVQQGRRDLEPGYNLEAARQVKAAVGGIPVILVGGMRTRAHMEQVLAGGDVDLVSMSRPFLREPGLARRMRLGEADAAACCSCNNCLAAVARGLPARCYVKGLPA